MNAYPSDYYDSNYYDYGDEYMYPGYNFERPVYLYIWEILVVITCLQNLVVLSVFLRRKMRNPTNFILSAIAISDTLTGLVTLPSYIMVFQRYDPLPTFLYSENVGQNNSCNYSDVSFVDSFEEVNPINSSLNGNNSDFHVFTSPGTTYIALENKTVSTEIVNQSNIPPVDGYILTKNLCRAFMISKYFLSKSFHTISIFLTLFLEIQRYISMAFPYRYETCFNRFRIVKVYCFLVFILCPLLHAYHLGSEKAIGGLCQWELSEIGCGGGCVYLWTAFILRHFIPSITMCVFTMLFIRQLQIGEKKFRRLDSNSSQVSKRVHENRRISFVVTAIVIVRLIPEIPYSIYLLYNSVDKTINNGRDIDIETNRVFHMVYEIALVVSFIANFYIYLIFNNHFRKRIYRTFISPVKRTPSNSLRIYDYQSSSPSRLSAAKRAGSCKPCDELELKTLQTDLSSKLTKTDQR